MTPSRPAPLVQDPSRQKRDGRPKSVTFRNTPSKELPTGDAASSQAPALHTKEVNKTPDEHNKGEQTYDRDLTPPEHLGGHSDRPAKEFSPTSYKPQIPRLTNKSTPCSRQLVQ